MTAPKCRSWGASGAGAAEAGVVAPVTTALIAAADRRGSSTRLPPRRQPALARHLADGEHRLGPRTHAEGAQHGGDMVLDGLDRQVELARDQLVRLALQQQREHLGLARREAETGERRDGRL